jgi:hypothetical protein
VPRVFSVNPAPGICRNELDSDSTRLDAGFVPEKVHVVTTAINKPHSLRVHGGLAARIVPFI